MQRWFCFIMVSSAILAGCGSSSVLATPAQAPTLTFTPTLTETPMATPTITETATPAKIVTEKEILNEAENREVDFIYLQSDEYLTELKEKDKEGKLPYLAIDPHYVKPGRMSVRFDSAKPSQLFEAYYTESAVRFFDSVLWTLDKDKPYVLVDAGTTKREGTDVGFFVVRWANKGEEPVFWGFTFVPSRELSSEEFGFWYDLNGKGYPMPAHFLSVKGCESYFKRITGKDVLEYCNFIGTNPDTALPKDAIRNWNKSGVLKLDSIPWSQAMPAVIGR